MNTPDRPHSHAHERKPHNKTSFVGNPDQEPPPQNLSDPTPMTESPGKCCNEEPEWHDTRPDWDTMPSPHIGNNTGIRLVGSANFLIFKLTENL